MTAPSAQTDQPASRWRLSLTQQIVIGLVAGFLLGWLAPGWALKTAFVRDIFINLIKSLVAPLIFSTVVVGIAAGGGAKRVGRLGLKSLLYFEAATTLALVVGLAVVNFAQPGRGFVIPPSTVAALPAGHPATVVSTLTYAFPPSIVGAMAAGDVLPIVVFAVIFGLATVAAGERARPVIALCESVAQIMFKFTDWVMRLAPLGAGAAIAVTIGRQGVGVLGHLLFLVGTLYVALALFLGLLLAVAGAVLKLPIRAFGRAVRAPFTLAFSTASSESALPQAMEAMIELGVPARIVGFVLPTGYSFNLDGSTLYLAVASVFVAQAAETGGAAHFGLGRQLQLMLALMVTSKGVAAVPRAVLVVLLGTLSSFGLPAEGVAVIFGVDALMDMARTSVNVFGNCLAAVVVAKWEGEFPSPRPPPAGR